MAIFTDIIDSDHPTTSTLYDLVTYDTSTKVISIATGTSIPANAAYSSDQGVTLQALYSHAKYAWKYDNNLIKHPFPFIAITAEQYEVVNGWTIDASTIQILRTGGFAVVDENGVLQEEWINVITLGNLNSNEQVYYTFDSALVPSSTINFNQIGTINECIKIFENGVQAKEDYLGLFVRTYGRTFDSSNTTDIGVTSGFDTQVYRFPLSTLDDVKLAGIDGSAITGVTFTEGSATKDIDANTGLTFDRVISANSVSLQNIYARTQYLLTLDSPIYGTTSGKTAPVMLVFLGDNVITEAGVFVETLTPAEGWVYVPDTEKQKLRLFAGELELYNGDYYLTTGLSRPAAVALKEICVFNRLLSEEETWYLYKDNVIPENSLKHYWPLNGDLTSLVGGEDFVVANHLNAKTPLVVSS